ncbi:MAG TPA: LamG-like jellyroll fold domain-containing protein, partial [Clostridia bacterium]|nr:LamG-like jellyroll fold domain-containing protein [Clostridia bacterium]
MPPPITTGLRYLTGSVRTLMLAFALLLTAGSAWAATLTYDFNNGSLQGWHNRVWDLNANGGSGGWVDLDPNVSSMPGTINNGAIQPESGDNNLFGNNGSQVDPVGGQTDNHLNTLWLRSPAFAPDGSGDLTVQMARGRAHGPAPTDEAAVSYMAADGGANTGWKGVALRNVSSGAFVLAKPRTAEGDAMVTVTFTAAELAPFVGVPCTLELINSERGGWGWLSMDNVSIPGVLRQTKLEVTAPSVTVGGSTTVTITIPSDLNVSTAVTAYLTNLNLSRITINGSAAAVVPVTFAAGAPSSQTVTVTGTALGYAALVVGCPGLDSARSGVTVLSASGLVGRWLSGSEDLLDKAGYAPAGTHDGLMSDSLVPVFSPDVPPGATGSSLDLASTMGAILISNSVSTAPGYLPTFDEATARQISVVFWAKGIPSEWNPFISKNGEGSTGWQVRRRHTSPVATFTLRGTPSEDDPYNASTFIDDFNWHHFAAVWDGVAGTRKLYVDGKLNVVLSHDFGPMGLAKASYLCLGGRVGAGSMTPGNTFLGQLYDVRIYGLPLSGSAVQSLFTANASAIVAHADSSSVDLGKTSVVSVAIPAGANASSAVTVYVTNTTPAVISLAGAVNNVATLVFPAGTPNSQTVTLTGLAQGQAQLACAATGLTGAS